MYSLLLHIFFLKVTPTHIHTNTNTQTNTHACKHTNKTTDRELKKRHNAQTPPTEMCIEGEHKAHSTSPFRWPLRMERSIHFTVLVRKIQRCINKASRGTFPWAPVWMDR